MAGKSVAFEVRDGREHFELTAANGQEIDCNQTRRCSSGCRNGMQSVTCNTADAAVAEE